VFEWLDVGFAREEHVGGREVLTLAIVQIEDKVVFGDEVARVETELVGGQVDGMVGTFEFDKGANGGFIEVDQEIIGPFEASGKVVGSAVLFVAEPAAQAETFEDFLEGGSVGEDSLEFLADLVATIGWRGSGNDGELFGRRFEGEEVTDGRQFGRRLLPFCLCRGGTEDANGKVSVPGGRFGANAKELAVFGQASIGSVEEEVVLVDARRDGRGAEFVEETEERFGVGDREFDFDFGRHGEGKG
jgi:hypothetical protein